MATALKVKAKTQGFRRAGFKFSATEETVIPTSKLTKEQIEALKAEPNLLVSEVELKDGKTTGNEGNGGGDTFDREAAFAYLATQNITPAKNIGDAKLKAQFDEAKAEEAKKAK